MKKNTFLLLLFLLNITALKSTNIKKYDGCDLNSPVPLNIADSSSDDLEQTYNPERTYMFGVDFGTNTSFNGVNQTSKQLYYSPNFTYSSKSGLYFYTAGYYLLGAVNHWDELDLNAGYDFNLSKKTEGSISYMKSLFSDISPQVNSSLTNDVQFYLKRKFWSVKTKLAFDYYFGTDTDYYITLSNSKRFTWEKLFRENDDLTITPKIRIVTGSQNFYYTKNHIKKPTMKMLKKGKAGQTIVTEVAKLEFGVISYIFTLPVSYTIGKFTLEPAFNYSIGGNLTARPASSYFTISFYCTL